MAVSYFLLFARLLTTNMQNDSNNETTMRRSSKYDTYIPPNTPVGNSILILNAATRQQPHEPTEPVHDNQVNTDQYYIPPNQIKSINFVPPPVVKTKKKRSRKLLIGPMIKATVQIDRVTRQSIQAAKRTFEPSKKTLYKTKKVKIMYRTFYTLATLSLVFTVYNGIRIIFHQDKKVIVVNKVGVAVKGESTLGFMPFEEAVSKDDMSSYVVAPQYPRWIRIPTLGIWSRIKKNGLDATGQMTMPDNINDVGWLDNSARPGVAGGAMVLAGYVAGPNKNGAFSDLYKLQEGIPLEVEKGNGEIVRYKVTKVVKNPIPVTDLSVYAFAEVSGKHDLKLVSIIGSFSKTNGFNSYQIVVYAKQL